MSLAALISSMISSNDCKLFAVPKMGQIVKRGHKNEFSFVEVAKVVCCAFKRLYNFMIHHPKTIQRQKTTRYLSLNFMVLLTKRYDCHWIFGQVETIEKWQIVDITQFHPKQIEFLKNDVHMWPPRSQRPTYLKLLQKAENNSGNEIQTSLHLDSFGIVGLDGAWNWYSFLLFNVKLH